MAVSSNCMVNASTRPSQRAESLTDLCVKELSKEEVPIKFGGMVL